MKALDAQEISLLNWNIQKQINLGWQSDLKVLSENVNLALFQEVDLKHDMQALIDSNYVESLGLGYQNSKQKTAVVTYANARPQQHKALSNIEPWLRVPKATNVTYYPLSGLAQSLLVINVHAINFTFGLRAYHIQMLAIGKLISVHEGPVILGGDFNTWHYMRLNLIEKLTSSLELKAVSFPNDKRKCFLGLPLDHVFTKGLDTISSETFDVKSSDHNPMIATFSVKDSFQDKVA